MHSGILHHLLVFACDPLRIVCVTDNRCRHEGFACFRGFCLAEFTRWNGEELQKKEKSNRRTNMDSTVFAVALNILLDFMSHQNSAKTDKSYSQSKRVRMTLRRVRITKIDGVKYIVAYLRHICEPKSCFYSKQEFHQRLACPKTPKLHRRKG